MTTSRDELRDHLRAALEAAPELPRGDREHLADVFLDQLDADYQLIPRSGQQRSVDGRPTSNVLLWARRHWWVVIAAAFAVLVLLPSMFWFTTGGYGAHTHGHYPFGFVPFLILLFALRFLGPWRYRRRW